MTATPLLDTIATPADIRRLAPEQLPQLAQELRAFLLESVGKTGGHFASNLGVVELTIALHYVFETPQDHLVWDVGHQSYPHKILTGRKDRMHTIRQFGGLAGFPKRSESEYDDFGVGHSSTSIGAALGMAVADRLSGSNARSVAVIGDGAMTAGQAFEALNNAGDMKVNLLVVLNDKKPLAAILGSLRIFWRNWLSLPLLWLTIGLPIFFLGLKWYRLAENMPDMMPAFLSCYIGLLPILCALLVYASHRHIVQAREDKKEYN